MHFIKYNIRKILNCYMFPQQGDIIRELFTAKGYKPSTPI
jgi:hypothetical protein